MESTTETNALQTQVKEYVARVERLERHRALLMGKEREAEEKEKARRAEEDNGRAEMQAQARALRQELSTLRDQHARLNASHRDLEHSSSQAIASAESQSARVAAVERQLELEREETAARVAELNEEREKRRGLEMELEREKAHRADAANVDVVKEELHRTSFAFTVALIPLICLSQDKSGTFGHWRSRTSISSRSSRVTSGNTPILRCSRSPTSHLRRRSAPWTTFATK